MAGWSCSEMPQKSNKWAGNNMPRWCNPAYDALSAKMSKTAALKDRIRMAKAMNDMLMQDYAMIPLIHRGGVSAHSNTCLLYTSPSPRDGLLSRMPSSA